MESETGLWVPASYRPAAPPRWPPALVILNRIDGFLAEWERAEFGPAHIVLSDYNLYDEHIRWCLEQIAQGATDDHPADEIAATTAFLQDLLRIPEADRLAEMDAYFGAEQIAWLRDLAAESRGGSEPGPRG